MNQREKSGDLNSPRILVSWGELIDKITILEIKSRKIRNPDALANVMRDLSLLSGTVDLQISKSVKFKQLKDQLRVVNEALWQIEDDIRGEETKKEFGETFIQLARSVYRLNDQRAFIKKAINEFLRSEIVEEKLYNNY